MSLYLGKNSDFNVLSPEEIRNTFDEWKNTNNPKLKDKLINHNIKLVFKIASKYSLKNSSYTDLVQEGMIGLIKGVEKYDPSFNVPFANYVAQWIRAYMLKHICNNFSLIKIGTTSTERKIFWKFFKERSNLEKLGIVPDAENLAKVLGITPQQVIEFENKLEASPKDFSKENIENISYIHPSPDDLFEKCEKDRIIEEKLSSFANRLNTREKVIFNERLLKDSPETLQNLGDKLGITKQRVQQLEVELIKKLKKSLYDLKNI